MSNDLGLGQIARVASRRYVRTFVDAALRPRWLLRHWDDRACYVSPMRVLALISVVVAGLEWVVRRFLVNVDGAFGASVIGSLLEDMMESLGPVLLVWGSVLGLRVALRWLGPNPPVATWGIAIRLTALVNAATLALVVVNTTCFWTPWMVQGMLAALTLLVGGAYALVGLREVGVGLKRGLGVLLVSQIGATLLGHLPALITGLVIGLRAADAGVPLHDLFDQTLRTKA